MTAYCHAAQSLPVSIYQSLLLWVEHGTMPGGFLRACLENNLAGAVNRADPESLAALRQIVTYIYWEIPGNCWGSPAKVMLWHERKSIERELGSAAAEHEPRAPAIDLDSAPCAICRSKEHGATECPHGSINL